MKQIKYVYKLWNTKSKTEKLLVKMMSNNAFDLDKGKHLIPMIKDLQESDTIQEVRSKFEVVLTFLKDCKDAHVGLKMLYICHETIDGIKAPFAEMFLLHNFQNLHYLKTTSFDVENYVSSVNSSNYYNFLLSYATYLKDLESFEQRTLNSVQDSLYQGNYETLIQLLTFKNIVKYGIKIHETLQTSLNYVRKSTLVDKITARIYKDIIRIYNLMTRCLNHIINDIFKLSPEMVVLLDEFYSETIVLTRKLRTLVISIDDGDEVPQPELYQLQPDFNKKEELFVLSVTAKYKIEKPYLEYLKQYQTVKHIREDPYCTFKLKKVEESDITLTESAFEYDSRLNTMQETPTTPIYGMRVNTNTDDLDIIIPSKTVLVKEPEDSSIILYQSEKMNTYSRKSEKEKNKNFIMKLPRTRNPKVHRTSSNASNNTTSAGMNSSFSNNINVQNNQSNDYSTADL